MDQAVTVDRPTRTRWTGTMPWCLAQRANDFGSMPSRSAASVVVKVVRNDVPWSPCLVVARTTHV